MVGIVLSLNSIQEWMEILVIVNFTVFLGVFKILKYLSSQIKEIKEASQGIATYQITLVLKGN